MRTPSPESAGWIVTELVAPIHLPGHLKHSLTVRPGAFILGDNDGEQLVPGRLDGD